MKTNNIGDYADMMLQKIQTCVNTALQKVPATKGAIVKSLNSDGTVNVYLPPNESKIFTHLINQTPFKLEPGDSVELFLKDGSYNSCWIIAKHCNSYAGYDIDSIAEALFQNQIFKNELKKIIQENIS